MKKIVRTVLSILAISLFIEVFVCNFGHFASKTYKQYGNELNIYYGDEFNGTAILGEEDSYSTIEIYDIEDEVKSIYIDFDIEGDTKNVEVEYFISDEGNNELYAGQENGSVVWSQNVLSSRYQKINAYGNVHTILIKINKDIGTTLTINEIKINQEKPIFFSSIRFLVIFVIIIFIYFLKNKKIFDYNFNNTNTKYKKIVIVAIIIVQIITAIFVSNINSYLVNDYENTQYHQLTDALIDHRVNLDITVDEKLDSLDNPYDITQRLNSESTYEFDTAFYKGKYYCYFGIAPVITFYIPYKLITGSYIKDNVINAITFTILSISIILMFYKMANKHFKKLPIVMYAILTIFAIDTCGALTMLSEPRIYTVPILYGLAFSMLGLTCWLYSIKDSNGLNKVLVFLGSMFIGFAVASRPQFTLVAFLAIIIFFDQIKDIKNNLFNIVIAIVPFIIIGTLLMYYNYLRFGSPLDFGANYNLTFNDMTKRGFNTNRIGGGLFYYLLQPVNIVATFPFIECTTFKTSYIGMLISEYSFGGLFSINPLTILSLLTIVFRKQFKNKKLFISSICLTIFGLIIILADTQMAGLVERYFSEFSIFFILSALIVLCTLLDSNTSKAYYYIVIAFMVFALSFSFLRIFAESYMSLRTCSPDLYYKVSSLIQFWL